MGKPRYTRKYPTYPEIPENKRDTRKYPIVYFDTLTRPEPDPIPGILFNTRPDPTRYWKTLPAGHWRLCQKMLLCPIWIIFFKSEILLCPIWVKLCKYSRGWLEPSHSTWNSTCWVLPSWPRPPTYLLPPANVKKFEVNFQISNKN